MDVLVVSLLKSNLKDPPDSNNYRPIAIATAASKLFELILQLAGYLTHCAHQITSSVLKVVTQLTYVS